MKLIGVLLFQYVIRAPSDGIIKQVLYKAGDTVQKGAALVQLETQDDN